MFTFGFRVSLAITCRHCWLYYYVAAKLLAPKCSLILLVNLLQHPVLISWLGLLLGLALRTSYTKLVLEVEHPRGVVAGPTIHGFEASPCPPALAAGADKACFFVVLDRASWVSKRRC